MLVLGVDPGLTRCGLGLVEGSAGRPLVMRHVEVVSTPSTQPLAERLLLLSSRIRDLLSDQPPDVVAVERMFSQHNLHTVMGTAQASAAAVLAAAEAGIPVVWHTPSEVKAAVTGSGQADKAQVAAMVVRILGLAAPPKPVDATDALALAVCHVWRGSAAARIDLAVAGAPPSRIPRRGSGRPPATRQEATAPRRGSGPASAAAPLPGARIQTPRTAP